MAYRIEIVPRAKRDLSAIHDFTNANHTQAARKWYQALRRSIRSLRDHPERCPLIPENHELGGAELCHLLFGRKPHVYRIISQIHPDQSTVQILHIRHGARRRLSTAAL